MTSAVTSAGVCSLNAASTSLQPLTVSVGGWCFGLNVVQHTAEVMSHTFDLFWQLFSLKPVVTAWDGKFDSNRNLLSGSSCLHARPQTNTASLGGSVPETLPRRPLWEVKEPFASSPVVRTQLVSHNFCTFAINSTFSHFHVCLSTFILILSPTQSNLTTWLCAKWSPVIDG